MFPCYDLLSYTEKQQVMLILMNGWESIRRKKGSVSLGDFILKGLGSFVCVSL